MPENHLAACWQDMQLLILGKDLEVSCIFGKLFLWVPYEIIGLNCCHADGFRINYLLHRRFNYGLSCFSANFPTCISQYIPSPSTANTCFRSDLCPLMTPHPLKLSSHSALRHRCGFDSCSDICIVFQSLCMMTCLQSGKPSGQPSMSPLVTLSSSSLWRWWRSTGTSSWRTTWTSPTSLSSLTVKHAALHQTLTCLLKGHFNDLHVRVQFTCHGQGWSLQNQVTTSEGCKLQPVCKCNCSSANGHLKSS